MEVKMKREVFSEPLDSMVDVGLLSKKAVQSILVMIEKSFDLPSGELDVDLQEHWKIVLELAYRIQEIKDSLEKQLA